MAFVELRVQPTVPTKHRVWLEVPVEHRVQPVVLAKHRVQPEVLAEPASIEESTDMKHQVVAHIGVNVIELEEMDGIEHHTDEGKKQIDPEGDSD